MSNELQLTKNGGLTPTNLGEAMQLAEILAQSTIVPKDYQRNPGNILVAIQWGAELGLAPMQAMQNIATINGRPSIWGDAMLALVKSDPSFVSITEEVVGDNKESWTAICTIKRRNINAQIDEHTVTFSMEDARQAGLSGKQGPWSQYPKRMLQMRARSFALRDMFPDVLKGIKSTEEVRDMPAEKDMGEVEQVEREPKKTTRDKVLERLNSNLNSNKAQPKPQPKIEVEPSDADLLIARLDSVETKEQLAPLFEDCKAYAEHEKSQEIKAAYKAAYNRLKQADEE